MQASLDNGHNGYPMHPDHYRLEYIELVGNNGVRSYRLYQQQYKWWTATISNVLSRQKQNFYHIARYPVRQGVTTGDSKMKHALHGMVNFLKASDVNDGPHYNAFFRGTIYLNRPLDLEGQYTDEAEVQAQITANLIAENNKRKREANESAATTSSGSARKKQKTK
jgi:hypothetical protein